MTNEPQGPLQPVRLAVTHAGSTLVSVSSSPVHHPPVKARLQRQP